MRTSAVGDVERHKQTKDGHVCAAGCTEGAEHEEDEYKDSTNARTMRTQTRDLVAGMASTHTDTDASTAEPR